MRPVALSLALFAAGCASVLRTPYERPAAPLPAAYVHAPSNASASATPASVQNAWWRSFEDPSLDALIELAIARNPDLAASAVRVRRASLQARRSGAALWPVAGAGVSAGASRPLSGDAPRVTESSSSNLGLSWEVDLFGRLDATRDAARFEALATAQDRDAVFLTLVGSAASLYWQIAFANERIASGEQSLASALRTRDLLEAQYAAGAVSGLERLEAEQSVAGQQAALSELRQTRTEARQALMVLLDGAPAPTAERQTLDATPRLEVAAGLPAELLGRRPDLRAAELRLRGVLASSDAARATYYPALTLTGALGGSSTGLIGVLANPAATLGANLSLPFLNVGAMRLDTEIARTQYQEAVILFRRSLYAALAEVENVLSARVELAEQGEALARARDAAVEAERRYEVRYRAGAIPLRAWLDAQERRRAAELALSANRLARLQNQVTLHQAIGGGLAR